MVRVAVLLALGGCAASVPAAPPALPEHPAQLVYRGQVFVNDQPGFMYTRTSDHTGPTWISTHRSHSVDDGEEVVAQRAEHSPDYALVRYHETHAQHGTSSQGAVSSGGRLRLQTERDGRTKTRVESLRAPAVTGPTLFGFIAHHWDRLRAGEAVDVRFVVAERTRTYGFRLRWESSTPHVTTITMRATRLLVRASVPPMRFTFDTRNRRIIRYEGRIPPVLQGRAVDARVEYEHLSEHYH